MVTSGPFRSSHGALAPLLGRPRFSIVRPDARVAQTATLRESRDRVKPHDRRSHVELSALERLPNRKVTGCLLTFTDTICHIFPQGPATGSVPWPSGLDAIDRRILALLEEDGRMPSAEIARRIERRLRARRPIPHRPPEEDRRPAHRRPSSTPSPSATPRIGDVMIDVAPGCLQDVAAAAGPDRPGQLRGRVPSATGTSNARSTPATPRNWCA